MSVLISLADKETLPSMTISLRCRDFNGEEQQMRRAEEEDKSPNVIGPQRYLQFPQNFGRFLNPPAEFLQREKI